MDSKNKIITNASGGASASVRDALGNVIASSYIADVSWDSDTRVLSCLGASGNVIGSVEIPSRQWVDDPTLPLTLRAVEDNSSVTLNKVGGYSGGVVTYNRSFTGGWSVYTYGTAINLNAGEFVCLKVGTFPAKSSSQFCQFAMTGKIEAWHNANSMVSKDFARVTDLSAVGEWVFGRMFRDCASLVKAPLLPAVRTGQACYYEMFKGCTSLTQAPSLPATWLVRTCYLQMFYGCTSLVQAPVLPATTLVQYCYQQMFLNCSSLNAVTCLATDVSATDCTQNWLDGVAASGDFYTPQATNWSSGASGCPANWTRHDI